MTIAQLIAALQALGVPGETEVVTDTSYVWDFISVARVRAVRAVPEIGDTAQFWLEELEHPGAQTVVHLET